MADVLSVELAVMEVFHQPNYLYELTFFSLRIIKGKQRKALLGQFFKCKLFYFKKNRGQPVEDFFRHPHFQKVFFFFLPYSKIFKVARVIEINSFDHAQKKQEASFFSGYSAFVLKLMYQKVSSQNNLRFLIKLPTENNLLQGKHFFYFDELRLSIKISKEIS